MCQIQEVETLLATFSKASYITNLYTEVNLDFPPEVCVGSADGVKGNWYKGRLVHDKGHTRRLH